MNHIRQHGTHDCPVLGERILSAKLWAAWLGGALVLACSSSTPSSTDPAGLGGAGSGGMRVSSATTVPISSGGVTSTGGKQGSGGSTATGSGGYASGTSGAATGGVPSNGGAKSSGGNPNVGGSSGVASSGKSIGGSTTTGDTNATGGKTSSRGASTTGGTRTTGDTTASAGSLAIGGGSAFGGSSAAAGSSMTGPCDIYGDANTPCVAAHSTVRALYGKYAGRLYQVQRASDEQTKDIIVLSAGGFADSASQDTFCQGTTCTISIIYDQSPKGNDLKPAPGGGAVSTADKPVTANKLKLNVGGHSVYGAYFEGGQGYRNNSKTTGLAKNDEPESMYMVASGKHYNDKCCWDYGNAETTNNDDGEGTMEAIYFGNCSFWGKGSGSGPWIMADIENGLWAGNVTPNLKNTPMTSEYITAMVKGKSHTLAVKGGNAQSGTLTTFWEGAYPEKGATGKAYDPMKKQGAIILGIGGDNSNGGTGTFFEGCITTGYATSETDDAIQANIVAAGYGR